MNWLAEIKAEVGIIPIRIEWIDGGDSSRRLPSIRGLPLCAGMLQLPAKSSCYHLRAVRAQTEQAVFEGHWDRMSVRYQRIAGSHADRDPHIVRQHLLEFGDRTSLLKSSPITFSEPVDES